MAPPFPGRAAVSNDADLRTPAPVPGSRDQPSLLQAYKAWQTRQAEARAQETEIADIRKALESAKARLVEMERQPTPDAAAVARTRLAKKAAKRFKKARRDAAAVAPELEERASRKGERLLKQLVEAGVGKQDALDSAFGAYFGAGGSLNRAEWAKSLVGK